MKQSGSTKAVSTKAVSTKKAVVAKSEKAGATGCVAVNAVPWAYVKEHDKRLGQTPMPCLALSPGKHTLVLENPALGKTKSVDVVVRSGDTAHVVEHFD